MPSVHGKHSTIQCSKLVEIREKLERRSAAGNSTALSYSSTVLLTVVVKLGRKHGSAFRVLCLIDQDNQGSYIRLEKEKTNIKVSGIEGESAGKVLSVLCITLQLEDGSATLYS